jgi:uncharacterized protein (DUF4415 family)
MSKDTKDCDALWSEYTKSLKTWMQSFESLQKAGRDVQTKYNEVMKKAVSESSQKTMEEFTENWQRAMSQAASNAFKEFGDNWQKTMNQSGIEQLKTYGEMMNKFAETWQKMWRK